MKKYSIAALAIAIALSSLAAPAANAAYIVIASSNAMRAVLFELIAEFERTTDHKLRFTFGPPATIKGRAERNEPGDVIILPRAVLDQLLKEKLILPNTSVDIARALIGVAVRADAPKPDVSTPEAFKRTLLAAKSIVYTDPALGGTVGHAVTDIANRLGVTHDIKPKTILNDGGSSVLMVVRGEAEMAIQWSSEIIATQGAALAGTIPAALQEPVIFAAAVGAHTKDQEAAKAFIAFLASPTTAAMIKAKGMEPGGN